MAVTKFFFNARLKTMMLLAAVAGGVIALRLVDIQVLRHNTYLQMAERNRTQVLYQTAPRGRVFTADGIAVASNAPSALRTRKAIFRASKDRSACSK